MLTNREKIICILFRVVFFPFSLLLDIVHTERSGLKTAGEREKVERDVERNQSWGT